MNADNMSKVESLASGTSLCLGAIVLFLAKTYLSTATQHTAMMAGSGEVLEKITERIRLKIVEIRLSEGLLA